MRDAIELVNIPCRCKAQPFVILLQVSLGVYPDVLLRPLLQVVRYASLHQFLAQLLATCRGADHNTSQAAFGVTQARWQTALVGE